MEPAPFHVGCAMWAHKPWIGSFFDPGTRHDRLLEAYSAEFSTVEGNTTFYAVPDTRTVARWDEQAPAGFRFVFKLPRRITHELRLRDASDELNAFIDRLSPIHDRLGPVFVQLPPSFRAGDLPILRGFLDTLPRGFEWAVEMRHRDFFVGGSAERPLDELLKDHGYNRVIMDSRCVHAGPSDTEQERDEIRSKPLLPVRPVATAGSPIVRFIGQTAPEPNVGYWQPWVDICAAWIDRGVTPYVFLHTPDNLASPHLARAFRAEVRSRIMSSSATSPVPEPGVRDSPS